MFSGPRYTSHIARYRMSYLVLARKSRPQTFDEVVGQRPIVQTLKNSIKRERIAHAILFSGVRGVGKTTLARLMAKAINCEADKDLRPCNECSQCRNIVSGASLDLYEIDGASNRGIQEIRELKEKIKYLPTSAKYKVIIIDEVHMLTTEAFNALLKTLEEPPAHVHFMFATTEIHKIPITILSRCQQYELKRVSANELKTHFSKIAENENVILEPKALSLIVREAGGSIRDGLSLLDQMLSFGEEKITATDVVEVLGLVNSEILNRLTISLLEGNRSQCLTALEEIFNYGMDIKRFLEDLLHNFRSLLLCTIDGCDSLIDLPSDEIQILHDIAVQYSAETLHLKLSLLLQIADEVKMSSQPRLILETSFLKIIEAGNVAQIDSLLDRINELAPELAAREEAKNRRNLNTPVSSRKDGQPQKTPPRENATRQSPETDTLEITAATSSRLQEQPKQRADKTEAGIKNQLESAETVQPQTMQKHSQDKPSQHKISPRNVRKNWPHFVEYIRDKKLWMAQDLQRAKKILEADDELQILFDDALNCSLLRQQENSKLLAKFVLDYFQKSLQIKFIFPEPDENENTAGEDSPQKQRQMLASDPLVIMATEVFTGQVGDIRIEPQSKK